MEILLAFTFSSILGQFSFPIFHFSLLAFCLRRTERGTGEGDRETGKPENLRSSLSSLSFSLSLIDPFSLLFPVFGFHSPSPSLLPGGRFPGGRKNCICFLGFNLVEIQELASALFLFFFFFLGCPLLSWVSSDIDC